MTTYTLLMLEISGIQEFIFGTNNLSVNVGASALVAAITREWVADYLPEDQHNIDTKGQPQPATLDLDDNLLVEAIYLGGGNALLMFRRQQDIAPFVKGISRQLLLEAPDLRVIIEQMPIDWVNQSLVEKLDELRTEIAQRKRQTIPNRPLPGVGVSAACAFTGQPAATAYRFGPPGTPLQLVSGIVATKRHYFNTKAKSYFDDLTKEIELTGMKPVSDFGDFGGEGSSFIAVVHADGNRMGERIKALGKEYTSADKNRKYANTLRAFSTSSRESAMDALQSTISLLMREMHRDSDGEWCWQHRNVPAIEQQRVPKVLRNTDREGDPLLPFRPVVFGGDDVTFVCDGRLGLALAHHYLRAYGQQDLADGQKAVGRAGIAIVNTHYPFAQAYSLAETLAKSAKEAGEEGLIASLDWHFGVNGVLDTLKRIRETSYTVAAGSLHSRPIRLMPKDELDSRHWDSFEHLVAQFQVGEKWRNKRSKLKGLQVALRGGPVPTRAFRTNYQLSRLPKVHESKPDFERDGWFGGNCPYFDALEALDFYIPLEVPA